MVLLYNGVIHGIALRERFRTGVDVVILPISCSNAGIQYEKRALAVLVPE